VSPESCPTLSDFSCQWGIHAGKTILRVFFVAVIFVTLGSFPHDTVILITLQV
jgi:hypothetical protein